MKITMWIAAAVLAITGSAWAQATSQPGDVDLDELMRMGEQARQQEQNKPADPSAEQPDAKPAEDENDLATLLLKKAGGGGGKPPMQEILDNMAASRSQLREKHDPGQETQQIQERIVFALDEAIARAQQASSSSSSSSSSQGQQKQQGQRQGQKQGSQGGQQPGPPQEGGQQAAQDSQASHGAARTGELGPDSKERGTEWGGLPPRDRQEVVQGSNEQMLPRWRAMIEKYYTALQVQSEKR